MEEIKKTEERKDKMMVIAIAGLSVILVALFIFFMIEARGSHSSGKRVAATGTDGTQPQLRRPENE